MVFVFTNQHRKASGGEAVVYIDGIEIKRLPLNEDFTYNFGGVDGGYNEISVTDKKVMIISASCPDQICVHHMPIGLVNEIIVCLPNKLVVEIEGGNISDIDSVAQ